MVLHFDQWTYYEQMYVKSMIRSNVHNGSVGKRKRRLFGRERERQRETQTERERGCHEQQHLSIQLQATLWFLSFFWCFRLSSCSLKMNMKKKSHTHTHTLSIYCIYNFLFPSNVESKKLGSALNHASQAWRRCFQNDTQIPWLDCFLIFPSIASDTIDLIDPSDSIQQLYMFNPSSVQHLGRSTV